MKRSRRKSDSSSPTAEKGVTRRDAIKTGAAAVIAGGILHALPRSLAAQEQPSPAPGTPHHPPPPEDAPNNLSRYLRDTRDAPWRQRVLDGSTMARQLHQTERIDPARPLPPGLPGRDYMPVITPNSFSLPFRIVNGVKIFHLIAEEVHHEFLPGVKAFCWGYNGHIPGPTIEMCEGERVRIYLTNKLPVPTSLHPHGFLLPNGMDGVSGLTNPATLPGETFRIEFTVRQQGTFLYHSHHDTMTQEGLGLTGLVVMHPRRELHDVSVIGPPVDRDFAYLLNEWRLDVGAMRPNTFSDEFNLFTFNGRAFPGVAPIAARLGQRVRFRWGNLSGLDHHPIHLHGHEFAITAENGFKVPPEQQVLKVTSLIPVGRTQDWEFLTLEEGDWIFHCHMTHHMMNQMDHSFPNMVGMAHATVDEEAKKLLPHFMSMGVSGMESLPHPPGHPMPQNSAAMRHGQGRYGFIPMGGMVSVLKVRRDISDEALARNLDPGWYEAPLDKLALPATADEMRRDGIEV